jgi:hypothetical protein
MFEVFGLRLGHRLMIASEEVHAHLDFFGPYQR